MSKGGAKRAAKEAEVMERIEEAAEKRLLEDTIADQQAQMERAARVNEIFWLCRHKILQGAGGIYSMPGEVIGSEIAEALLHAVYQQMLANALAQRRLGLSAGDEVRPGDIRLVSPVR